MNKNEMIVDDMTESAGTLISSSKICKEAGAKNVECAVTHGAITEHGFNQLNTNVDFTKFICTNTIDFDCSRIKMRCSVLDTSQLFAKAIRACHLNESVTELFKIEGF